MWLPQECFSVTGFSRSASRQAFQLSHFLPHANWHPATSLLAQQDFQTLKVAVRAVWILLELSLWLLALSTCCLSQGHAFTATRCCSMPSRCPLPLQHELFEHVLHICLNCFRAAFAWVSFLSGHHHDAFAFGHFARSFSTISLPSSDFPSQFCHEFPIFSRTRFCDAARVSAAEGGRWKIWTCWANLPASGSVHASNAMFWRFLSRKCQTMMHQAQAARRSMHWCARGGGVQECFLLWKSHLPILCQKF